MRQCVNPVSGLLCLALCLCSSEALSTDYSIGPGQPLAAIGEAPWATLQPGDRVLIHWQSAPYLEKWVINRRGTAEAPIIVRGIPGPGGELPVIDGRNAVTPAGLNFWNEERGVIKIGGSNTPADALPAYIIIENLEIRSARPPFTFFDDGGSQVIYADNAAAIYVEKAEHLTIRGCVLHNSGNGIFAGAFEGQTRDMLIESNHIFGNGNIGSAFHHNTYTSSIGIVYQYNHFGPLRDGSDGNNLKDRSAGLVVRYNWIEDGNRQLDLVDSSSAPVIADPMYRETFVYGNILIESDGQGNSQILHYGGDSTDTDNYRKGDLYFYHNTVVSTRSGNTTLLRLSTNEESADAHNNILYVTASGNKLAMLSSAGDLTLRNNWLKAEWQDSHSGLTGTIDDNGSGIQGTSPGFADEGAQDFTLLQGSDPVDAGTTLLLLVLLDHQPLEQYIKHQLSNPRPDDGILDLGAYELCSVASADLIFYGSFETTDTTTCSIK